MYFKRFYRCLIVVAENQFYLLPQTVISLQHLFHTLLRFFYVFFFNRKTFVESVIKIVLPPDDMENVKGENVLPQSK